MGSLNFNFNTVTHIFPRIVCALIVTWGFNMNRNTPIMTWFFFLLLLLNLQDIDIFDWYGL